VYTFGQLKSDIRKRVFPAGEASNLVASHDKMFIDAMMDLQTWVKCLQYDHTDLVPQCATLYNCGLTVFDAPRGSILKVSVVDRIDPTTGAESAEADIDWCSEVPYSQVNPTAIRRYLNHSQQRGCCLSIPFFFGLPYMECGKARFPIPTDEGLPNGLPLLPLGYHYPQTSTDQQNGRAQRGVWGIERGKIYVAPWIQSTETIMVKWDGLKRKWSDSDPVDEDPKLSQAVEEYVRWKHADLWDKDQSEAQRAAGAYSLAMQNLIHDCREETRIRDRETSLARASSVGISTLYYNDEQSYTASCDDGFTGDPVTVTIPSGTVGSNYSVSDANEKAKQQAKVQAEAQLVCTAVPVTYKNTIAGDYTATCTGDADAPTPDGVPVHIVIPAGTVEGASVAEANAAAQTQAESQARAQLTCTFWNRAQSFTAHCDSDPDVADITKTIAAGTYSASSQAQADELALTEAENQARAEMEPLCVGDGPLVYNTVQVVGVSGSAACRSTNPPRLGQVAITAIMEPGRISDVSQDEANRKALEILTQFANQCLARHILEGTCGAFTATYPVFA